MLLASRVQAEFDRHGEAMRRYQSGADDARARYRAALTAMGRVTRAQLLAAIPLGSSPGALPTVEHDRAPSQCIPFDHAWPSVEEARRWAADVLGGVTTLAVDGSQIPLSKDISLPVAAIQIGWFENDHVADERYTKDVEFTLLPPEEMAEEQASDSPAGAITLHRFVAEAACLRRRIERFGPRERPPVVFWDGTLVLSFAEQLEQRDAFIAAVVGLLQSAERHRVALVGYVDRSYAQDLLRLLDALNGEPGATGDRRIRDADLFPDWRWGDRTPLYQCARQEILRRYRASNGDDLSDSLGFVYMQTGSGLPPARLDLPLWIEREGLLDYVLDVVRAETVIGQGYPYALEAADAVAVLTMEDRRRFYELLERYALDSGLPWHTSAKSRSKQRRRV